jgi:hypothetical protein
MTSSRGMTLPLTQRLALAQPPPLPPRFKLATSQFEDGAGATALDRPRLGDSVEFRPSGAESNSSVSLRDVWLNQPLPDDYLNPRPTLLEMITPSAPRPQAKPRRTLSAGTE